MFACTVLVIEPSVLLEVVPPFAFQFQAAKVFELPLVPPSLPNEKPSESKEVNELANVYSALVSLEAILFKAPLVESNS